MTHLPEYDSPPVVETVLGVQFAPLPWTAAHAGWYWRTCLRDGWPTAQEAPRLDDAFERFGSEKTWPVAGFKLMSKLEPARVQIIREDGERMVQVQDSRFIYNWQKKSGQYPTYRRLLPEFRQHFENFELFLRDAKLPELTLNQWEIVYVNHIMMGDLWDTPRDWPLIFSGFLIPTDEVEFESHSGTWAHIIGNNVGRLHIEFRHGKRGAEGKEMVRLQLTARGPISDGSKDGLAAGFDIGHTTIVNAFTRMTSDRAHERWKRRK